MVTDNQRIKGYELQDRIGAGGFGAVYRAYQSTVGREVAIKIILPGLANQPEFIRRFEGEAQLVARLEHPHITPLYDYWRDPDGAYLVMRWLRGGSLYDALQNGPFELHAAALLLDQISGALSLAHRNGIIHRDIKPGNILLDEDGNAYLTDFGIAKDLNVVGNHTGQDVIVGSLDYISPEQARSEAVTSRTDIYSLGVTLYEVIVGHHPFENTSSVERLYKHINDPLPEIETLEASIQAEVNRVIQKATAKNPEHRYPDALAFAADFRQAIGLNRTSTTLVELLTQREQDILRLIIDGLSNKEIAQELNITLGTVKWYVNQIYSKMGVRSRVQAIVRARELNLINRFDGEPDNVVIPTEDFRPENPYKGLRAFQSADNQDFFGREKVIARLVARMSETAEYNRFLAVVGPSGSGKSSLVKAGLIPALWRGELPDSDKWFIVEMLPGSHPLDELEVALTRIAANQSGNLKEHLRRDNRGLLRAAGLLLPNDSSELVVLIDQFEEVFTLLEDEAERSHLLELLYTAVTEPRSRVRVIVTLRADFYDRPLHYAQFAELIRHRIETIMPLSTEELERAIARPAERVGVTFEQGLVAAIIGDINYQPGALPLLQYALTELFEQRRGRLLTRDAYQAIGKTIGALAKRAEEIYLHLNEADKELTRQVFLRLVMLGEGTEDTRRRTLRSELLDIQPDGETIEELLDNFAAYRLLSLDNDTGSRQPTVEIAHEALIREWERLKTWISDSREDIRQQRMVAQAADAWHSSQRDTSYLLSGNRLEQAEKWYRTTQLVLTPLERAFLDASVIARTAQQQAESERQAREIRLEQRSQNFLRGLVAVFASAALIAIGLSIFAFNQSQRAENQTMIAEEHAARAQNVALVAGSQAALTLGNTDTALALALEAVTLDPTSERAQVALSEAAYTPGTVRRFEGHQPEVNAVDISPDGLMVISASDDKTMILWDIQTGAILRRFESHSDSVSWAEFSPDGRTIVSGSWDKTAILWDVQTGQIIRQFEGYNNRIYTIAISPDGQSIVAGGGGEDSSLIQWNVQTGQIIRRFEGHISAVSSVEFSPNGNTILSGSADQTMILWDVQTGQIIRQFGENGDSGFGVVLSIAISPDGLTALSGDTYSSMILWDLSTGEILRRFETTHGWVFEVAFSPDGRQALAAGGNSTISLWDIQTGNIRREFHGHTATVLALAFTPDGSNVVSGSGDGTLRLWDLNAGQLTRRIADAQSNGWQVDRSPNGHNALSTLDNGTATLWDIETGEAIRQYTDNQPTTTVSFSPDGRLALIGTGYVVAEKIEPGHLILWDLETGEEIRRFSGHPYAVYDVEFSPDGQTAVSCGAGGTMILWDIATGQEIRRFYGYETDNPYPSGFGSVAFSPDGHTILSVLDNGTLILWDSATGEEIRRFMGHTSGGDSVRVSNDGQLALSASYDSTAILWNVESGEIVHRLNAHTGALHDAVFSPDDQLALTGSGDGTSILWNLASGQPIRRYSTGFYNAAFSPDGTDAFVSFPDGSLELWRIDATVDELLAWTQANRYVPELTCDQRELYQLEPLCDAGE